MVYISLTTTYYNYTSLLTKNVFISLFLGLLLSNLVIFDMNIIAAINGSLNGIVAVFESRGNTIVILVLLLIGALIHIIEKSGGIEGFVKLMVEQKVSLSQKERLTYSHGYLV